MDHRNAGVSRQHDNKRVNEGVYKEYGLGDVKVLVTMELVRVTWVFLALVAMSHQHGMLVDPVNRASMWRQGFNTPPDYNDNQLFCGGREVSSKHTTLPDSSYK